MIQQQFSRRLNELRKARGISARSMSLSLGHAPSYISHIESGKFIPRLDTFFGICRILGVTPKEFFKDM